MKRNEIWIRYGTDYRNMAKQLCRDCGLADLLIKNHQDHPDPLHMKIALKPNLVNASPASLGGTTHTEVAAGVLDYLGESGFDNLVLMEGSWVGERTQNAVRVCGYDRLCEDYGIPFVDTQKDQAVSVDAAGMELKVCPSALAADAVIGLPVLKGHCQTKVTCALKNMKGLLPNSEKRRFHAMGLHRPIAHLNTVIRQDFVVVDNICGDPDFEDGGNPVVMNRILAGTDPVLIDAWACRLLHYEAREVPYIQMAQERGVGCGDPTKAVIRISGEQDQEQMPYSRKVLEISDCVEEVESCSACYGYLVPVLDRLRSEGLTEYLKEHRICIGQGWRGKTGELGIGTCTRGFSHHLEGCPPMQEEMYEFLKDYIQASIRNLS